MKKYISAVTIIFILLLFPSCDSNGKDIYEVTQVVDGDTFIIDDEYRSRVRIVGLNTPEILNDNGPGEPFADDAYMYTKKHLLGKNVRLEYDQEKYDPYGRLLAYVFVNDSFFNSQLLKEGLARTFIFKNQNKYRSELVKAENQAKKLKKGIWGNPSTFSYNKGNKDFFVKSVNARSLVDQRVLIKGKITETKENKKVVLLSLEDDLDIVIFKDNLPSFSHFDIDPKTYYSGMIVEVIGRISIYRGKPQIAVHHPISIRVMR